MATTTGEPTASTTAPTPPPPDEPSVLREVLATFPVGIGVLAAWFTADALGVSSILPPSPQVRVTTALAVLVLVVGGHLLARWRLGRLGRLVAARRPMAWRVTAAYVPLAALVASLPAEGGLVAVAAGALAMTSPGVHWVVLDGSAPRRGVARVGLAVLLTPVAAAAGFAVGYGAFFVWTMFGSFVFGFLAGHAVTFAPLSLVGPGEDGVASAAAGTVDG